MYPVLNLFAATCIAVTLSTLAMAVEPLERIGPLAQATLRPDDSKAGIAASDDTMDEVPLLKFVETHQPALLKLLKFMKNKQPQQYEQALKELSRVTQRLTSLEKRDLESYAIELEHWQVRSKLRMLVAEVAVAEADAAAKLKSQLHQLVRKDVDLEAARLTLEKKRIEQRLEQVTSQLQSRTDDREAVLSKSIKTWENRAFKSARPKNP